VRFIATKSSRRFFGVSKVMVHADKKFIEEICQGKLWDYCGKKAREAFEEITLRSFNYFSLMNLLSSL
jgi:hypothetical protein